MAKHTLNKLESTGMDYIVIDDLKQNGTHLYIKDPSLISFEDLKVKMRNDMKNRYVLGFEMKRFRSLKNLTIRINIVAKEILSNIS